MAGKRYKGDKNFPIKTEAEAIQEMKETKEAKENPDMMDLEAYCRITGVKDFPTMAAMNAYTKTTKATKEAWDSIFKGF